MSNCLMSRRDFMAQTGKLSLVAFLPIFKQDTVLRPPGAIADFLARCIRCGKCMEVCPYDSIRFLGITAGALAHTPYIDPLKTPCYLCLQRGDDGRDRPLGKYLRCGEVCPTGALVKIVNDKQVLAFVPKELKMGVATLDRRICLAWQYESCGECYHNCPLKDQALLSRPPDMVDPGGAGIRPHVNIDHCIGCGMCSFVCPVREHIAAAVIHRQVKLTLYEERYAAMVRNLVGRAGGQVTLPAIRVIRQ